VSTQIIDRPPPIPPDRSRWPLAVSIISLVVLVAAAIAGVFVLRSDGNPAPGPTATPTASATPSTSTSASSPSSSTPSGTPSSQPSTGTTGPTVAPPPVFGYQPLWPFGSRADVAAWQRAYRHSGSQPWHLDAARTALSFTTGYLGYTEIDRVTSQQVVGNQAWTGVGYRDPAGRAVTAAVLHLARMGSGPDAPWEVVGSRDTTLSLTIPPYGATRTSPVTVGGRITGVDESLTIQVHALGWPLLGEVTGIPAGGQQSPWSVQVLFTARGGTVLTVAVSTGGHVQGVERFAVTGIVAGPVAAHG
jgi:hypothetical protein